MKICPQTFLGAPWAEKMTLSSNFACCWTSDTSSHNQGVMWRYSQKRKTAGNFFWLSLRGVSNPFAYIYFLPELLLLEQPNTCKMHKYQQPLCFHFLISCILRIRLGQPPLPARQPNLKKHTAHMYKPQSIFVIRLNWALCRRQSLSFLSHLKN